MEQTNYGQELYTRCVHAGRRRYYIDVKSTRSGKDCYITITESRRVGIEECKKTKIFLFREDFDKFMYFLDEAIGWANKSAVDSRNMWTQTEKSEHTPVAVPPV